VWLGISISFIGLLLLIGPSDLGTDGGSTHLLGAGLIVLATLSWATGSIYSRTAKAPASPMMFTAMQMLFASVPLLIGGLIRGESAMVNFDAITLKSVLAWLYLIVFGSVIALTAYIWLLKVSDPARVGTYAYVNPVIAVVLGWAFNGEILSTQTLIGAALIVAAVIIIISRQQRPKKQVEQKSEPQPNVDSVQCADA
jgi:drug/metabolite transporter (DMT)-like permease